jgi:hypothetical protein
MEIALWSSSYAHLLRTWDVALYGRFGSILSFSRYGEKRRTHPNGKFAKIVRPPAPSLPRYCRRRRTGRLTACRTPCVPYLRDFHRASHVAHRSCNPPCRCATANPAIQRGMLHPVPMNAEGLRLPNIFRSCKRLSSTCRHSLGKLARQNACNAALALY